jgi:hypothetical protein
MAVGGKTSSKLIWFKEIITAILALTIICAIMVFLAPALLASPVDATSAQAIFAVLGGWGGVVIGYYFGRIPAEKAADKAEKVADAARSEKDRAEKEKVNEIVTSNEKLADYEAKFKELLKQLEATEEIIKKSDEE